MLVVTGRPREKDAGKRPAAAHLVGVDAELARLFSMGPKLTAQVIREDYSVLGDPGFSTGIVDGTLRVDRLTPARAGIVSLIVAQSAAMEYYERIVDRLFARTASFVERLERYGTVPFRVRRLHRFIGEAISTRSEVLQVLHLLDKPEAAWDDPEMDRIYGDLRAEFDLVDRYRARVGQRRYVTEQALFTSIIRADHEEEFIEIRQRDQIALERRQKSLADNKDGEGDLQTRQ